MPRREAGFTLIEVLAALAILALALSLGYRLVADGARSVAAAELKAGALAIAEAQMAALGTEDTLTPGTYPGAGDGYRWTLTVTPRRSPPFDRASDIFLAAYDVTVTVVDPRGSALSLSTLRLAAAAPPPP